MEMFVAVQIKTCFFRNDGLVNSSCMRDEHSTFFNKIKPKKTLHQLNNAMGLMHTQH